MYDDDTLPKLIPWPSVGGALGFGLKALPQMLLDAWWYYIALAVVGIAAGAWVGLYALPIAGLAAYPALGTAARFVNPSFRLTVEIVLGLVAIGLIIGALYAICYIPGYLLATQFPGAALPFNLLTIWISTKFGLASAFYVLEAHREDGSIFGAVRRSWSLVTGGDWWRLFGVNLSVVTMCILIPILIRVAVVRTSAEPLDLLASLALSTFSTVGFIVAQMWMNGSLLSLATSVRPLCL